MLISGIKHKEHSGTIDLLIYNKNKNKISLVDWKTNKQIKTKENAYRHGMKGTPAEKIYDCNFEKYSFLLNKMVILQQLVFPQVCVLLGEDLLLQE